MPVWEPPRHDELTYVYFVPAFEDIKKWVDREPTRFKCSINSMKPGHVIVNDKKTDIWLCVGVVDMGERGVDIHQIYWHNGVMGHIQQIFTKSDAYVWDCCEYTLDRKANDDYCPHCHIMLEWTTGWRKCPQCWWRP